MAATEKYGEAYDAEYVDKMVGKVLVQACAAVTLNKPHDPIEYLSLWLHKYCDNAITLQEYELEKQHKALKEVKEKEAHIKRISIEQELINQQNSTLNYMQSITNDPYLLWDTCLRAINTYTSCQAAYVAVVVRKIFEPKPKKKKKIEGDREEEEEEEEIIEEPEEGEEGEGKEGGSDTTSIDDEPPEADEEKREGKEREGKEEPPLEEGEEEGPKEGESEEEELPPPKPFRVPKPLNYKNRRLLYVSTTIPSHIHMLNRQMVIKEGPVTFSLLIEGLQDLYIPNVLYKEGIHYFGGCPRVGAYFVVPMSIEYIAKKYLAEEFKERPSEMFDIVKQKQVIALLCCDTLKSDSMGNGRPFQQIELDFIQNCANTMSIILNENNKEITKNLNTPEVIQKFKDQLREIKLGRVEQMKVEKEEALKRKKAKEKLKRLKTFQELHKAWEEHQAVKAKAKAKLERQKEKERKKKEDVGEEVLEEEPSVEEPTKEEEVEDNDPEPILEPDPEEEALVEGEEEAVEEPPPVESEEEEEGEDGEEKEEENEFNDEELEPNSMAEIEGEGGEDVEGEAPALEEELEEEPEELEEPNEVKEKPPIEGEEGVEKPKESKDMIKLKERKKAHAKKEKEIKKEIKALTKLGNGFGKKKDKAIAALEKLSVEVEKYEKALFIANGVVQYLKKHMENAHNLIIENKSSELDRIRRWPYPNRHIQRILKALLYLLGHKKIVIDDWNLARKLFNQDLLDKVLKNYDPIIANEPTRWEDVDLYLTGLNDKKLHEQACIGYLLQQWILSCKKTTAAAEVFLKIKAKYEELQKEYATLEMEKIMCEVETQILDIKLKKMIDDEEMRIEKEVDEIEVEEKHLVNLVAQEAAKKEEEDKMYAEYATKQQAKTEAEIVAEASEEGA